MRRAGRLALCLLSLLPAAACGRGGSEPGADRAVLPFVQEPAAKPASPNVSTGAVPAANRGAGLPADGYLAVAVAHRTVEVTAELDGELSSLAVAVGDRVEPGSRIATLTTREINEQLASARAALTALEAEHKRSEIELESVKDQYDRRAAFRELYPKEELAELLSKEKSAAAAVETAAARVAEERGHVAQ
ncbi:MAG TPA: biotin/lipoyl-binding protein, partial [Thermoanaerobaculia bacterium]|nr:biotin/lipoyl-binding protein [Thermoanaerobaculia bacterium]